MARRLLNDKDVSEIIIFSRDEKKQHDMRLKFFSSKLKFIIGDIRDRDGIFHAMHKVDYVFHAAALKQVPTGEFFPIEMTKTNIIGTQNVLDAAEANGVKKVVVLTTDKAVYPINAMGISKAMAEKLVIAKAMHNRGTIFCAVRYGNVMASRGSVIPLFVEQIKNKKPLTVTDPKMTRFLLSLEDAINLVLFAIKKGENGDVFIKKAPAATIEVLARALCNIFGTKNEIKSVGVRAGEKIHETLATKLELAQSEEFPDYFRIKNNLGYNYADFMEKGDIRKKIKDDYTSQNTKQLSLAGTEKLLLSLDYIKEELKQW